MTAVSPPAAPFAPVASLHRHWRLVAFLVIGFGPFAPSIVAMREFLLSDNALGFVPVMLPLALFLFWRNAHEEEALRRRDIIVDLFFAVPLIVLAAFVLLIVPARMSWYYWLNRMDLLALPLWAGGVAFILLGYQQVMRTWPAFLLLFFVWPYPAVWLQRVTTGPFVDLTTDVARAFVDFLRLPYAVGGDGVPAFTTTHLPDGERFSLVVGQLCSGTAATLGFLQLGGAMTLLMQGSAWRRLGWLALGLGLALLSNLLRVGVLLTVAARESYEVAVNQVHPVLGAVLFLLLIVLMLALIRPFGLRFHPAWRGAHLAWEPVAGGGRMLRLVWVLLAAAALGIGWGVAEAQRYDFIGVGDGAPVVSVESSETILPAVDGWELEHLTQMSWTDLFGRASRGDVWTYAAAGWQEGDPWVAVQTVIAERRSTLDRYSFEQCIDFHGREVEGRLAVDLGYGVTGIMLHETYYGVPGTTLYWLIPVNADGELRHARIALMGDIEQFTRLVGEERHTLPSPRTAQLGRTAENALSLIPEAQPGELRATLDRGLVQLAVAIIDELVTTGGPGLGFEPAEPSPMAPVLVPLGDLPAEATPAR